MELKEIKNGRYKLATSTLVFDTDKGEVSMKATEALEIAYTLFDYCNLDYSNLYELEKRLLDDIEISREEN